MKPKIYAFSGVEGGSEGPCYAMAQDGTVLGSHWCSHEHYALHDLGVIEGARPDRHETYRKYYQDGYEMEFVPAAAVDGHHGLQEAIRLNQSMADAAEK